MEPIPYKLIRSNRKTVGIELTAQGIVVRAPFACSDAEVAKLVEQKRPWIESHMPKAAQTQPKLTDRELRELADRALAHIPKRVAHFAPLVGVRYGRITIRNQRTLWGSCSSSGNLNFNCLLMLAPEEVIDYVVVHELCHRLEMNHSPRFWAQVERVMPDYRKHLGWLKEHGQELMGRQ